MSAPQRIQRKRTRGWRMPEGARYVGRPGIWGNPFELDRQEWGDWSVVCEGREWAYFPTKMEALEYAVREFREHLGKDWLRQYGGPALADVARELGGRDLACWCQLDQPCHADVLLDVANGQGFSRT